MKFNQCLAESLENLPRSYELSLLPETYLSPLRDTSKLLKLSFSRIISRKDINGSFDIPAYIDIYLFSDLSVNFGVGVDKVEILVRTVLLT